VGVFRQAFEEVMEKALLDLGPVLKEILGS